ncbi:tyrosine-type recombinase/integrase [Actinoplanes sp. NEAU-A12]|uniref:Tyrosine-type recombinase/integrase n=1 Tax=Actinoplanes sandaracinus TaxID=3045177 RepID=A0ABT6WZF8_9ACTN|nr:tyrosine-type recombinase/integrase [Actinoplanes sandaracinus]MDI6105145.1 tyrosine-type recombinase/integrase [Actinoplanes sandaracinus]
MVTELQPIRARRTGWKPFLYHLDGGQPERRRTIKLKAPRTHPTILTAVQVQAILDACTRLRDRFLFAVLWDTGIRIGEALGLRHEDLAAVKGELAVIPRVNDNRARAKSASPRAVPVGPEIVRLYADYLHAEYGDLDSDYMFVNLWGGSYGRPLTYAARTSRRSSPIQAPARSGGPN